MAKLRLLLALISIVLSGRPVAAADVIFQKGDKKIDLILISGEIKSGDDTKFKEQALKSESAVVILASQGGALVPALEIGRIIQIKGFATLVPNGETCTSSCALIWLSGSKRLLSRTAKLGFHASYRNNNGSLEEVGVANAIVGRYLTLLNLSERTVVFTTKASPYEITWLTAQNKSQADIDFRYFDIGEESNEARPVSPPPIQTQSTAQADQAAEDRYHQRVSWYFADTAATGADYYVRAEDVGNGRSDSRSVSVWVKTDDRRDKTAPYTRSQRFYI